VTRRQRTWWTRIAEAAALGLTVLSLVFYFALVRPLRHLRIAAEEEARAAEGRIRVAQARVTRLEQYRVDIPQSESELEAFLDKRVVARRQGFSHAARMMRRLSEDSKVRMTSLAYKLSSSSDEPLARMTVELDVEGSFSDLMRFTHALETTGDFVKVRAFSYSPVESRTISMHVGADLYLKP
jgi:Tfp pilus assembly protein PilO